VQLLRRLGLLAHRAKLPLHAPNQLELRRRELHSSLAPAAPPAPLAPRTASAAPAAGWSCGRAKYCWMHRAAHARRSVWTEWSAASGEDPSDDPSAASRARAAWYFHSE